MNMRYTDMQEDIRSILSSNEKLIEKGTGMAYRFVKRHYKLTKDQKERGVIFSSQLKNYTLGDTGTIHEVFADQEDKDEVIARLKDVKFFKNWAMNDGFNCELIERS